MDCTGHQGHFHRSVALEWVVAFFFMSSKNLLGDPAFQISLKFKFLNNFIMSNFFPVVISCRAQKISLRPLGKQLSHLACLVYW